MDEDSSEEDQSFWADLGRDDSFVHEYEARVEPFTASFVDEMMQPFLNSKEKSVVLLDVGCGTGAVSLWAGRHGFSNVTATDVNAAMIRRLRQRHADEFQHQDTSLLETVVANGQSLPSSWTDRFDYAVGAFSVIFFPNVSLGLKEIHRCLKESGQLVISAWGNAEQTPAFRVFPDAIREVAPRLLQDAEPKRITGSPLTLQTLLEEAGFEHVKIVGPIQQTLKVASAEEYYNRFALASPNTISSLSQMTQYEVQGVKQKVMEIAAEQGSRPDGSIELPSSAYFAYGKKPSSSTTAS